MIEILPGSSAFYAQPADATALGVVRRHFLPPSPTAQDCLAAEKEVEEWVRCRQDQIAKALHPLGLMAIADSLVADTPDRRAAATPEDRKRVWVERHLARAEPTAALRSVGRKANGLIGVLGEANPLRHEDADASSGLSVIATLISNRFAALPEGVQDERKRRAEANVRAVIAHMWRHPDLAPLPTDPSSAFYVDAAGLSEQQMRVKRFARGVEKSQEASDLFGRIASSPRLDPTARLQAECHQIDLQIFGLAIQGLAAEENQPEIETEIRRLEQKFEQVMKKDWEEPATRKALNPDLVYEMVTVINERRRARRRGQSVLNRLAYRDLEDLIRTEAPTRHDGRKLNFSFDAAQFTLDRQTISRFQVKATAGRKNRGGRNRGTFPKSYIARRTFRSYRKDEDPFVLEGLIPDYKLAI